VLLCKESIVKVRLIADDRAGTLYSTGAAEGLPTSATRDVPPRYLRDLAEAHNRLERAEALIRRHLQKTGQRNAD
jgi:hypothetical protein